MRSTAFTTGDAPVLEAAKRPSRYEVTGDAITGIVPV